MAHCFCAAQLTFVYQTFTVLRPPELLPLSGHASLSLTWEPHVASLYVCNEMLFFPPVSLSHVNAILNQLEEPGGVGVEEISSPEQHTNTFLFPVTGSLF